LNLAITHREHDLGKQENAVGIEVGSKHNYTLENHGFYMNFNLDPFIKSNLQVGLWFELFFYIMFFFQTLMVKLGEWSIVNEGICFWGLRLSAGINRVPAASLEVRPNL